ncbi:MAG: ethanolamine ammonia-lyase reactivating factor EutA [Veillonella sp.]|uniref:ethanolamine ammonia-lyase reactivating factor EutA n=1 Tax=Veillonella sp. TaxID=1926307 RepID=UPI001EB61DB7|nr:ethanolamine ammonia-lyase reactivating factor EutA [Veillonella sp.]MBS5270948.1 ethanolamine ammonia-lyase reactivating factor EutA [Veillonella sp.]
MDKETLLTVGIDLGTSTTQLILSELTVENFASAFTVPRIEISDKKVIYRSDIIFTPLINQVEIDENKIKEFVALQYDKAGIVKDDIKMGAVIITGETARKSNSSKVLQALSGYAGDFVVATAGPDLESIIAGKGAGTETLSREHRGNIVNFDIGGGTSNLAMFRAGDVVDTACFDIGGRLIKIDSDSHTITYIAPKILEIIEKKHLSLAVGSHVVPEDLMPIIDELVNALEQSIGLGEETPFYNLLITHHDLKIKTDVNAVTFSGGVADCIKADNVTDWFQYGDIGLLLGNRIKNSLFFTKCHVLDTVETIRATVVGAGSHTAEVSGSTISYTDEILPIKNVPVLKLAKEDEQLKASELAAQIRSKLDWYLTDDNQLTNVALSFQGIKSPSFADIQRYAMGITEGVAKLREAGFPLLIIVTEDMAKALGNSIYSMLPEKSPFVCIDSIVAENGDYIDIGTPVAGGNVLPVIIKTLVFN